MVSADLTHLTVGDSYIRYRSKGQSAAQGYLWLCSLPANGAGAAASSDWLNADGTWDYTRKPRVGGSVSWSSQFLMTLQGSKRQITGNGLPSTPTGTFPIQLGSVAYKYDGNRNAVQAQAVNLIFDEIPNYNSQPFCTPYGANGIALTGSAIYHGASTLGTDAAAFEMLDDCGGHTDGTGTYHYHMLTECMIRKLDPGTSEHSAIMGYMIDGFGIYGPRGVDGKLVSNSDLDECHGHTHSVSWDGKNRDIYHYHWTFGFPYTVGCYRGQPLVPWNGRTATAHVHPHPPKGERVAVRSAQSGMAQPLSSYTLRAERLFEAR